MAINAGMNYYNLEFKKSKYNATNSALPIEFCLAVFKLFE